jgi:hypothetical protein
LANWHFGSRPIGPGCPACPVPSRQPALSRATGHWAIIFFISCIYYLQYLVNYIIFFLQKKKTIIHKNRKYWKSGPVLGTPAPVAVKIEKHNIIT